MKPASPKAKTLPTRPNMIGRSQRVGVGAASRRGRSSARLGLGPFGGEADPCLIVLLFDLDDASSALLTRAQSSKGVLPTFVSCLLHKSPSDAPARFDLWFNSRWIGRVHSESD